MPDKNYLFDLAYIGGLQVLGDKACDYLQGQVSCDVREVHLNQMRPGALCNLKGRILALLDVVYWNGLQLLLPLDLMNETQKSLEKSAFFSKVQIAPSTNLAVFGFYLANTSDLIPFAISLPNEPKQVVSDDAFCCYHLGEQFYIFIVDKAHTKSIQEPFIPHQLRGSLAWHALLLEKGYFEIYPESRGLFLPHRLGLQHTGHLSFNKGCYKGQEIIARTHYRAKLKHEMKLFTIETKAPLHVGQLVLDSEGKSEIGELVDYCPIADSTYLIAISALFEHPMQVLLEGHVAPIVLKNQRSPIKSVQ